MTIKHFLKVITRMILLMMIMLTGQAISRNWQGEHFFSCERSNFTLAVNQRLISMNDDGKKWWSTIALLQSPNIVHGFVGRLLTDAQKLKKARLRTNIDDAKSVTQLYQGFITFTSIPPVLHRLSLSQWRAAAAITPSPVSKTVVLNWSFTYNQ